MFKVVNPFLLGLRTSQMPFVLYLLSLLEPVEDVGIAGVEGGLWVDEDELHHGPRPHRHDQHHHQEVTPRLPTPHATSRYVMSHATRHVTPHTHITCVTLNTSQHTSKVTSRHVTYHTSRHVTYYTSRHVTSCHIKHVTTLTHVISHFSRHVTCYTTRHMLHDRSHATRHVTPHATRHIPHVKCHTSHVTSNAVRYVVRHMSHVTSNAIRRYVLRHIPHALRVLP